MNRLLALCAVLPVLMLSSCELGDADSYIKRSSETKNFNAGNIDSIEVSQCIGKCTIKYGDTEDVQLKSSCTFSGISEKKVSSAYENTKLSYNLNGGGLYVCFMDMESGSEIGKVSSHTSKYVNTTTDIDIILPKSFKEFTVRSDVGDIQINDLCGRFDLSADVGDIDLDDVTVTGDSSIGADVGNVKITLSGVERSTFSVNADVGNIELDTQGIDYKEISRSDKLVINQVEVLVDDKCTFEMKADLGNIEVRK